MGFVCGLPRRVCACVRVCCGCNLCVDPRTLHMNAGRVGKRQRERQERGAGAIVRKLFPSLSSFAYEMRFYRKLSISLLKGGKTSKVLITMQHLLLRFE